MSTTTRATEPDRGLFARILAACRPDPPGDAALALARQKRRAEKMLREAGYSKSNATRIASEMYRQTL